MTVTSSSLPGGADGVVLTPNWRWRRKAIAGTFVVALLPAGLALLAAATTWSDLRRAYWIAAVCSLGPLVFPLRWLAQCWRPAAILRTTGIVGRDGVELPREALRAIQVRRAFGDVMIGIMIHKHALKSLAPRDVRTIKARDSWYMVGLAQWLPYEGLNLPGKEVVALLGETYGLPVRGANAYDGP
jgi:lysylphosphatidylglycerol synthetase-like protein (DUF2156 family)